MLSIDDGIMVAVLVDVLVVVGYLSMMSIVFLVKESILPLVEEGPGPLLRPAQW